MLSTLQTLPFFKAFIKSESKAFIKFEPKALIKSELKAFIKSEPMEEDTEPMEQDTGSMEQDTEPMEEDTDNESLFVKQPGEIEKDSNTIDLTEETEAESAARAARVGAIRNEIDLTNTEDTDIDLSNTKDDVKVKSEDDKKKAVQLIPDDDSESGPDLEEVADKLEMLRAQQKVLQRRQAKGNLKPRDVEQLKTLGQEIKKLDHSREVLATGPTKNVQRTATPSQASSSIRRKRRPAANPNGGATRKKPRRAETPAARRKSQKAAQESTRLILGMLQNPDTILAGQEMADLPVLDEFSATTITAQKKCFEELLSKNPDADKDQIRGDRRMLVKARVAIQKHKILGEKYLLPAMNTPLFAYQFAAAGWMVAREKSVEGPQGGILADSMGLGKTVETLACIAGHPPSKQDLESGLRTTLVIVPASAVGQWIEEVWKHCNGISVSHYRRSDVINQASRDHSPIW